MKANLTAYNRCFSVFDSEYDQFNQDPNPIKKGQNAYTHTKNFITLLDKHKTKFLGLDTIKAILEDMNTYFAETLMQETSGRIKVDPKLETGTCSSSHLLAKRYIKEINIFLNDIDNAVKTMKQEESQYNGIDKLDTTDRQLFASSSIQDPAERKIFGGMVDDNIKTQRSNASLLCEFKTKKNTLSEEEQRILKTLTAFANTIRSNDNKLGFNE